jgi:hypothetical protein
MAETSRQGHHRASVLHPAEDNLPPLRATLKKKTHGKMPRWQSRFFVCEGHYLSYFRKSGGDCMLAINLERLQSVTISDKCNFVLVTQSGERFDIRTESAEEAAKWVANINVRRQFYAQPEVTVAEGSSSPKRPSGARIAKKLKKKGVSGVMRDSPTDPVKFVMVDDLIRQIGELREKSKTAIITEFVEAMDQYPQHCTNLDVLCALVNDVRRVINLVEETMEISKKMNNALNALGEVGDAAIERIAEIVVSDVHADCVAVSRGDECDGSTASITISDYLSDFATAIEEDELRAVMERIFRHIMIVYLRGFQHRNDTPLTDKARIFMWHMMVKRIFSERISSIETTFAREVQAMQFVETVLTLPAHALARHEKLLDYATRDELGAMLEAARVVLDARNDISLENKVHMKRLFEQMAIKLYEHAPINRSAFTSVYVDAFPNHISVDLLPRQPIVVPTSYFPIPHTEELDTLSNLESDEAEQRFEAIRQRPMRSHRSVLMRTSSIKDLGLARPGCCQCVPRYRRL